jgi:hypothetical protein
MFTLIYKFLMLFLKDKQSYAMFTWRPYRWLFLDAGLSWNGADLQLAIKKRSFTLFISKRKPKASVGKGIWSNESIYPRVSMRPVITK